MVAFGFAVTFVVFSGFCVFSCAGVCVVCTLGSGVCVAFKVCSGVCTALVAEDAVTPAIPDRSPAVSVCPQAATLHNSPSPGNAIKKATNWLKSKTKNETVDTYLSHAYSMPEDIVVATSEPYVKSLKDDGKFDIKEQQQAFELLKMRLNRLQAPKLRVLLNQP